MSPSSLSCLVVADVVHAERVRQSSSGRLVVAHLVEASKGRVQDGLLHNDGDEAVRRSFACSLVRSFVRSLVRLFSRSLVSSFTHLLVRLFPRSLVPSFACLLVRLFARSRVC